MKPDKLIAIDTETGLMGTGNLLPPLVCVSYAERDEQGDIRRGLIHAENPELEMATTQLLEDEDQHFVGHNIAYDWAILCATFPDITPLVFNAYEMGRIHDTIFLDKLYWISSPHFAKDADMYAYLPDGSTLKLEFALDDVEKRWIGRDRTALKKNGNSWRKRFIELLPIVNINDWPKEAVEYVLEDADGPLLIAEAIWAKARGPGEPGSVTTEAFQAASAFALWLTTVRGMTVDRERVEGLNAKLNELLSPARMKPLYDAGLITPMVLGRVLKNGKKCADKPEKKNLAPIREHIRSLWAKAGQLPKMTDGGESGVKNISTDSDVLQRFAQSDDLCKLLLQREEYAKMASTWVPTLRNPTGIVHFNFDALKVTGRTSSYANSEKRIKSGDVAFDAMNGQNLPRVGGEFSIRECYIPRPGYLLASVDYSGIELVTVAQTTYSLFGFSMHRNLINEGIDLHGYLASRLASRLDSDFGRIASGLNAMDLYKLFMTYKKSEDETKRKFFKHWRTFAKPVGLGYPGGLGPETFVDYARASYEVIVSVELAATLREIWHETYPEMREYFRWVSGQHDPSEVGKHAYVSPYGMLRASCSWSEAANGKAMQTPTAEGAKTGHFKLVRECYDQSLNSPLLAPNAFPVDFIHDENLLEILDEGPTMNTARVKRIETIMIEAMQPIVPDVTVRVEPTLMDRWYKEAEPVYNDRKELLQWQPPRRAPAATNSSSRTSTSAR